MSLTGPALLVVVLLLTGAAFAGCVAVQPRLVVPGLRYVLARGLSLLLVNGLVLLSALVAFNDHYQFFADTTDLGNALFGTTQSQVQFHAGGGVTPVGAQPAPTGSPTGTPGSEDLAGVQSYVVQGDGVRGRVLVSLPKDYSSPDAATRRYPVLLGLHGYPGGPTQMFTSMGLRRQLDRAVARHDVSDAVILSPEWEVPGGIDTECVDGGTHGPAVETWLTRVVPAWAAATFRLLPAPGSWSTVGLSAGGWCAAMLALRHPQQFGAAVVLGGYFAPEFEKTYRPFGPHSATAKAYDLVRLAARAAPRVALFVETSKADSLSYPSTLRLLRAARPPTSVDAVVLTHAGHRLSVWADEIPHAYRWLGSQPGFAPT